MKLHLIVASSFKHSIISGRVSSPGVPNVFTGKPWRFDLGSERGMRAFLSPDVRKIHSAASSRSAGDSMFSSAPSAMPVRNLCLIVLVVCGAFLSSSFAQQPVLTSRADISRSGANTNETLLTPTNVSQNSFGRLFSFPVDYVVMAQPLYVPNVKIPGHGTHNVIYVVTQADSVSAIDADTGTQLWYASMLNVGGTTASGTYLPCGT